MRQQEILKYLSKWSFIEDTDVVTVLYYEDWTGKWKYFYIFFFLVSVDKRGRSLHETEKEDLHKFYELGDEEEDHEQKPKQHSSSEGTCVIRWT